MAYTKAPLPFIGQKRNWLRLVSGIDFSDATVLDLFGGSGLLSHHIKQQNPSARVIYNDYDNYSKRLKAIAETEAIRGALCDYLKGTPRKMKLTDQQKSVCLNIIEGASDYLTIASWLLFSSRLVSSPAELATNSFWNTVSSIPLTAADYLAGVEVESLDYQSLFEKYQRSDNLIVVADPPYLYTEQKTYKATKHGKFFGLADTGALLRMFKKHRGILFSSDKSEIPVLLDMLDLSPCHIVNRKAGMASGVNYTDQLYLFNMEYAQ